ncbi:acyl-CoA thioesterase [Fuerstiella marisgermanici]|nr:thioesterase family protein [Fuerstiella marisgermanici]
MSDTLKSHSIDVRVRYSETDAMGLLHHANYLTFFEMGRTELFRAQGGNYRRMEELKLYFVVASIQVKFKRPARYDDLLTVETSIARESPAKLEHHYEIFRDGQLLCSADSVIACVDENGNVQRIPSDLANITGV